MRLCLTEVPKFGVGINLMADKLPTYNINVKFHIIPN